MFVTFNDSFHFAGLNWTLKDVKHTILSLQKQLTFKKYFAFQTHFATGGKELKNAYFYPCLLYTSDAADE